MTYGVFPNGGSGGSGNASRGVVVFRPGLPSSGIYKATWAEVETAINAAQKLINVLVDSSNAPAIVPSTANIDGEWLLTLGSARSQPSYANSTLQLQDGARFTNLQGISGNIQIQCAPTVRSPFHYTPSYDSRLFILNGGSRIEVLPGATLSPIEVPAGTNNFEIVTRDGAAYVDSSGANIPLVNVGDNSSILFVAAINWNGPNAFSDHLFVGGPSTILVYLSDASVGRPNVSWNASGSFAGNIVFEQRADEIANILPSAGNTAGRPTDVVVGQVYWNTDLSLTGEAEWWDGTQWVTGSGALSTVVFRPGLPSSGIYKATWAEVEAEIVRAENAITMLVDSSNAAATVPNTVDLDGRSLLVVGPYRYGDADATRTLTFQDGARFRNLRQVNGPVVLEGAPTIRSFLRWDPGASTVSPAIVLRDGTTVRALAGSTLTPIDASGSTVIPLAFFSATSPAIYDDQTGNQTPILKIDPNAQCILIVQNAIGITIANQFSANLLGEVNPNTSSVTYAGDASAVRPDLGWNAGGTYPANQISTIRTSNTANLLPSAGNTAARPTDVMVGQMYFNTDLGPTGEAEWWDGANWVNCCGGGGGALAGDVNGPVGSNLVEFIQGIGAPNPVDGIAEGSVPEVVSTIFTTPRSLVADGSDLYVGQSGQGVNASPIVWKLAMLGQTITTAASVDLSTILASVDRVRDLAQDATYLYAATWDAENVAIIDKATFTVVGWAWAGVGQRVHSVATDGAGTLFAIVQSPNRVHKFNVAACVGQPPSTVGPIQSSAISGRQIRYGSVTGKLWITSGGVGANALTRVDPVALVVEATTPLIAGSSFSLASVEAFGSIWVTAASEVARIDPVTMIASAVLTLPSPFFNSYLAGICSGPDYPGTPDQYIWAVSMYGGPYAAVIDPATDTYLTAAQMDTRLSTCLGDIVPIGTTMYAAAFDSGGSPVTVDTFDPPFGFSGPVVTPNSHLKLFYRQANGDVYGNLESLTVQALQGNFVVAGLPPTGSYLQFSGAAWQPGSAPAQQWFGHTAIVDPVYGNDATASVNGKPFLTIKAALAAANAYSVGGTKSYVLVLPGQYYQTIADLPLIVGPHVSMGGLSRLSTIIWAPGASAGVGYTVIQHNGDEIQNLSVNGVSGNNTQSITGVLMQLTGGNNNPRLSNVYVQVDNQQDSGNPTPPGTFVIGIDMTGGATAEQCTVYATGGVLNFPVDPTKTGYVKGIRGNGQAINCDVTAGGGNGTYYGAQTDNVNHTLQLIGGTYSGALAFAGTAACIKQSTGTLRIANIRFQPGPTATIAGSTGFTIDPGGGCSQSTWENPGPVPLGVTRWMYASAAPSANNIQSRVSNRRVAKSISVRTQTGPGASTDVWTLQRNGFDTGLTVSLTGANTTATLDTVSVDYLAGDTFGMKQVTGANSTTTEVVVDVDWYEG